MSQCDVEGTVITPANFIECLDTVIDGKLKFGEHLKRPIGKVEEIIIPLVRVMPSIVRPQTSDPSDTSDRFCVG